jgi:hypothetical protein
MARAANTLDFEIEMKINLDEGNAFPQMKKILSDALFYAFRYLRIHFEKLIMTPMVLGGKGWRSVEDTASWRWINSPEGFGQLGFTDATQPLGLLIHLLSSWKADVNATLGGGSFKVGVDFGIFDIDDLIAKTPHPAAGTGNLPSSRSWFEWVYKGIALQEPAKFVKTGPRPGARSSAIAGSDAGIMHPKSTGLWQVPPRFRLDLEALVDRNQDKIITTIEHVVITQMNKYLDT